MRPTWPELRARSEAPHRNGVTFCADCYFLFRAGAVDGRGWGCRKHTLPEEINERDRDINAPLIRMFE